MTQDVSPAADKVNGTPPPDNLRRFALGAIYVLSALVILALAGVVYAVFARAGHPHPTEAAGSPSVDMTLTAPDIQLPARAVVQNLQVSGDRLILELRTDAGTEVDIIDLHNGHLVARITSTPAQTPAPQ